MPPIAPEEQYRSLTENALIEFIKKERQNIIDKVLLSYPNLPEDQIKDIFQDVCLALVEKAHDSNFRLSCSLFHFVYRCCWHKAEHDSRHPERKWQLPTDDILQEVDDDSLEMQPIQPEKVDELLNILFEEPDEREELLNRVCEVVKDLPEPCDRILYGMYGNPRKKQEAIARECGYASADVVKTVAARCKNRFREKFRAIYESFKKGL